MKKALSKKLKYIMVLCTLPFITQCGKPNEDLPVITWKEEIQLENGPALWFNRSAKGIEKTQDGQMRAKEMTLDLVYPLKALKAPVFKTQHIPVLIDYQEQVPYRELPPKQLIISYRKIDQTWTMVVAVQTCQAWREAGSPKLPYIAYQISNHLERGGNSSEFGEYNIRSYYTIINGEKWEQIPLDKNLIGRKANILSFPKTEREFELITLPEKQKRAMPKELRYQTILNHNDLKCDQ